MSLLERYVLPHRKVSRPVTAADLPRVKAEAAVMLELCGMPRGVHERAFALAHPQIDDQDPLAFFVTDDGAIILNPKITGHGENEYFVQEGCLSLPDFVSTEVTRWHKISVSYQVINVDELSTVKTAHYANLRAQIWQHEINHLLGNYIV